MQHNKTVLVMAVVAGVLALSAFVPMIGLTSSAWTCGQYQCVSDGRMTGGGVLDNNGAKVTLGFELHCSTAATPNNLEVNWNGNSFHMETFNSVLCFKDPSSSPNPPNAPFSLLEANGWGRLNGVSGAFFFVQLYDGGEPGIGHDWATIVIYAADGTLMMNLHGYLIGGNFQAHASNK